MTPYFLAPEEYAGVPDDTFLPYAAYEHWLEAHSPGEPYSLSEINETADPTTWDYGIVGGGHAGLYSALLLLREGVPGYRIHIHESSDRIGGRVWTYNFRKTNPDDLDEVQQYADMGAMRLPDSPKKTHQTVFDIIDYVNSHPANKDPKNQVVKKPYIYSHDKNRIYVNHNHLELAEAKVSPENLGFPDTTTRSPLDDKHKTGAEYFTASLAPIMQQKNPITRFQMIMQYDNYSFRQYLKEILKWSYDLIDYVETMTSAPGQYDKGFPEVALEAGDFIDPNTWFRVDGGMSRLTDAIVRILTAAGVTIGTGERVYAVANEPNEDKVDVSFTYKGNQMAAVYDRVIMALPVAPMRAMNLPQEWPVDKIASLRSLEVENLYKAAVLFKERWWDNGIPGLAIPGGQSVTDRPPKWIVYPSDPAIRALMIYAWEADANGLGTLTRDERVQLVTSVVAQMHLEAPFERTRYGETVEVHWAREQAGGNAHFLPGKFTAYYRIGRRPEGKIVLCGEQYSTRHGWISGAYASALFAVSHLLGKAVKPIRKAAVNLAPHNYDYNSVADIEPIPGPRQDEDATTSAAAR